MYEVKSHVPFQKKLASVYGDLNNESGMIFPLGMLVLSVLCFLYSVISYASGIHGFSINAS